MGKISIAFILLCLSLSMSACGNTTEKDRFNLLFNHPDSEGFIWKSNNGITPKTDSSELINSKHPIYYEAFFIPLYNLHDLKINLSQTFVFPSSFREAKELEIAIHNKSIGMNSLKLKIAGVDTLGYIVKTDSIDIDSHGEWSEKSIKIGFDNIQLFTVAIIGDGKLDHFPKKGEIPRLYLDRMSITIDGKSINRIKEINNFRAWDDEVLHGEEVYPLNMKGIPNNFIKETGMDQKRVIALGETVHGSKEINETVLEIAKSAIMNNNCKLILNELSLPVSMKINLFLQNKLEEREIANIREELREFHICLPAFIDFLSWLREYNKTTERKVMVFGLMDTYKFIESPLYGYLFAFYNNENRSLLFPLLEKLHRKKLKEAFDFVTDNSEDLKQILNKDEFFLFKHSLENLSKIETEEMHLNTDNYDYYMWLNAKKIISEYLKEDESVLIHAHYAHVKKNGGLLHGDPTIMHMGAYLYDFYKDDYGVIGITVGKGTITSREQTSEKFTIIDLEEPGSGSIEKIFLSQDDSLFYYPSKRLCHNVYSMRYIGNRASTFTKKELFDCLKTNTDGFIFIRNSDSFKDNYPYSDNYFWDRGIERAAFLKKKNL